MENTTLKDLVVVKRSGQRVEFNQLKIAVAIKSSFDNTKCDYEEADINKVFEDTLKYIIKNYQDRKTINVEDIQDIIEKTLINDSYKDIYESFSDYRIKRAESRKAFSEKQQHKFVKAIEKIANIKEENETAEATLKKFGETIASEYSKCYVIDNKYLRSHDEGKIFIHHLPYFNLGFLNDTHLIVDDYLNIDDDFLALFDGLNNVKNEIDGEIAIDNFDIVLNKFSLNKFKLLLKGNLYNYLKLFGYDSFINYKKWEETIDKIDKIDLNIDLFNEYDNNVLKNIINTSLQDSLDYLKKFISQNINHLFTTLENNNQRNIYSFSFGLSKDSFIKNIILNEINRLPILNHVMFIYKLIKDEQCEDLENVGSLILNGKNILIENSDAINDINYFSNGLKVYDYLNISTGRSNIANTSINLARLGLKYHDDYKNLYLELDDIIELVKSELAFVFETIGDKVKENYQYLFNGNILDDEKLEVKQHIRKVIKNGTLNINLIGLKECASIMSKENSEDEIISLIKHIKNKLVDVKYNYTLSAINELEASSAMIELDKTIYGLIPNYTKKSSYDSLINITNLNNYIDDFKMIEIINDSLNGGFIVNIDLNKNLNLKKLLEIIKNIKEYNLGIIKFNIKGDIT